MRKAGQRLLTPVYRKYVENAIGEFAESWKSENLKICYVEAMCGKYVGNAITNIASLVALIIDMGYDKETWNWVGLFI